MTKVVLELDLLLIARAAPPRRAAPALLPEYTVDHGSFAELDVRGGLGAAEEAAV